MNPVEQVREKLGELTDAAWTLAAVAALPQRPGAELDDEHGAVLGQAGLATRNGSGAWVPSEGLAALLADPAAMNLGGALRQMVGAASGTTGWANQEEATLQAQGDASQAHAAAFLSAVVPRVADLDALLRKPDARMLDVGTGAGGIPTAWCTAIPTLRAVGIDVLPGALDLAQERIAAANLTDRVEFRRQNVAELADHEAFDVAWLPAVFVPPATIRDALPKLRKALKPGGAMVVGIAGYRGVTRSDTIVAWRVVDNGGTPWTSAEFTAAAMAGGFTGTEELAKLPGVANILLTRRAGPAAR